MARTRHLHQRMNQRGITERMLQIVRDFGVPNGDKQVLDKGHIDLLVQKMDQLRKDLLKVRDKGGLVLVEDAGCDITAYRVDSFRRS